MINHIINLQNIAYLKMRTLTDQLTIARHNSQQWENLKKDLVNVRKEFTDLSHKMDMRHIPKTGTINLS